MRKLFIAIVLGFFAISFAQPSYEVTPMGGGFFAGSLDLKGGKLNLSNGGEFNINAGANFRRGTVEFSYTYAKPTASADVTNPEISTLLDDFSPVKVNINYLQLSFLKPFILRKKPEVVPFFMVGIGAVRFNPDRGEDVWNAAMSLGGGMKYFINDKIGIRIQGRMLMPFRMTSLGIGFGTGEASVSTLNAVPILQGELSGGIIFRIGNVGGFFSKSGTNLND